MCCVIFFIHATTIILYWGRRIQIVIKILNTGEYIDDGQKTFCNVLGSK